MNEFIGAVVFGLIGIAVGAFLVIVFGMLLSGPAILVKFADEEVHHHHHHGAEAPSSPEELAKYEDAAVSAARQKDVHHHHHHGTEPVTVKARSAPGTSGRQVVHHHHYHGSQSDAAEDHGGPEA